MQNIMETTLSSLHAKYDQIKSNTVAKKPQKTPMNTNDLGYKQTYIFCIGKMSSSENEIIELEEYCEEQGSVKDNIPTAPDTYGKYYHKKSPFSPNKIVLKSKEKIFRTKFRERFQTKKTQAKKTRNVLEKYSSGIKALQVLSQTIQNEDDVIENCLNTYNKQDYTKDKNNDYWFFTNEITNEEGIEEVAGGKNRNEKSFPYFLNIIMEIAEKKYFWTPDRYVKSASSTKVSLDKSKNSSKEETVEKALPQIPSLFKNILKQRLLLTEERKWFNSEGNLKILKSPLENKSYRPTATDSDFKIKRYLKYASPHEICTDFTEVLIGGNTFLQINIHNLKFQHHPLFSVQHVLQNNLLHHYYIFKQQVEAKEIDIIGNRLDNLRSIRLNLENRLNNDGSSVTIKKIKKNIVEMRELREKLQSASINQNNLLKTILKTWKMLKLVRQRDQYTSTPIKLIILKQKQNYVKDKEILEEEMQKLKEDIEFENGFMKCHEDEEAIDSCDEHVNFDDIKTVYKKCFREPGEPIIDLFITRDEDIITKTMQVNDNKEKLRRSAVKSTKFFFKLFLNETEVCRSKSVQMDDDFDIEFDEIITIKSAKGYDSSTITIFEQTGNLQKKNIYKLDLNLFRSNLSFATKDVKVFFENLENCYQKYGIGCGLSANKIMGNYNLELDNLNLFTSGFLLYDVAWTTAGNNYYVKNENENSENHLDISFDNLPEKFKTDSQNSCLSLKIDATTHLNQEIKGCFKLNHHLTPLMFCKNDQIKNNIRLKMLRLRDKNVPEFYGLIVPISEKEISEHRINEYEKINKGENIYNYLQKRENLTIKEGENAIRQIYFAIFQKCRNIHKNLAYDELVNEKVVRRIENFGRQIINFVLEWLTLNTSINLTQFKNYNLPKNIEHEPFFELKTPFKIYLTVQRAVNVPKKLKHPAYIAKESVETFDPVIDGFPKLRVVLKHKNKSIATKHISASNPIWNETLVLEIESLNIDILSPEFLSGFISIYLFEITERNSIDFEDEKKVYFGSTNINISSIYQNEKLEGIFHLETPTFLFGYEQENNGFFSPLTPIGLYMSVSARPILPKLSTRMEELQSNETPSLRNYILQWNSTYNNNFPERKFSALVIDVYGKTTCVTRFISPIQPPQLNNDNFQITSEQLVKYFSMFSFTDYNKFYENIWLTAQQFLKIKIGSIIDHAIALTCCLTSLELQAWLLLGFGIPGGSCAYVLVKEFSPNSHIPTYNVFDVVTGSKHRILDKTCSLQNVFCLIDATNVWANIQKSNKIQNIRFDLSKRSDWLPLYTDNNIAPSNPLQHQLHYNLTDVKYLKNKLEKKIHKKIAKMRKMERTKWHMNLTKSFTKIMPKLNIRSLYGDIDFDIIQEITKIQMSHKITGFLISKQYRSSEYLFEFLENTNIFKHSGFHSEFVLTTQLVPLPNNLIMLWLLVAVIH